MCKTNIPSGFFLFSAVSLIPIWFPLHKIRHLFTLKVRRSFGVLALRLVADRPHQSIVAPIAVGSLPLLENSSHGPTGHCILRVDGCEGRWCWSHHQAARLYSRKRARVGVRQRIYELNCQYVRIKSQRTILSIEPRHGNSHHERAGLCLSC